MKFDKAEKTYRQNAVVQKDMAAKLSSLILSQGKEYENIFEIGSGTGFLTEELVRKLSFKELILNDIEKNQTGFDSCKYIQGDILQVELPQNLNLAASNAVFQWIENPDLLLKKIKTALKTEGLLAFTTFGEKNFEQIKDLGMGSLKYYSLGEIENLLKDWEILYLEQELFTLYFEKPRDILKHIKATGVTRFGGGLWTKSQLEKFEENYETLFSDNNGVELTYHPIYCLAGNYT